MSRTIRLASFAIVAAALTGCVSNEKYNALKLERDQFRSQLELASQQADKATAEAELLKSQLAALNAGNANAGGLVANLQQQNADLQSQLNELNRRYAEAMGRVGAGPALPVEVDNALRNFANQNPDLIEFDSQRGIVKFKSDVTFATGEATLTSKAQEVIGRFASILNSAGAAQYELLVAGHTDNVPVNNPATIQRGHKNNWYLSSHRAISVGEELMRRGIGANRLGVAGYADQRPAASNATAQGKAMNRRVEVLILPASVRIAPASPSDSTARTAPANMNKDTASTPVTPVVPK